MNKKIVNGENGPKEVDIETVRKQEQTGFCQSKLSRIHNRGITGEEEKGFFIPPFDEEGFDQDLHKIYNRAKDIQGLLQDIQLFNDTYLYPASTISLVLFDEKGQAKEVHNAKTFANIERSLDDWALKDKASIASYAVSKIPKGSYLLFPDAPKFHLREFYAIPENYNEILELESEDDWNKAMDAITVDYEKIPQVKNYELLRKEHKTISKEKIDNGDVPICTAIVAPLWHGNKLLGVILISYDAYHGFTQHDQVVLEDDKNVHLSMMLSVIASSINKLKQE